MTNLDFGRMCAFWETASDVQRMAVLLLAEKPTLSIDKYAMEFKTFRPAERKAMIEAVSECSLFRAIIEHPIRFSRSINLSECVIAPPEAENEARA